MPIIAIPSIAREKAIYYAAVIVAEGSLVPLPHENAETMVDFFQRRWEGYIEAVCDVTIDAGGFIICEHDHALEAFHADLEKARRYLVEHHPTDFTTRRLGRE